MTTPARPVDHSFSVKGTIAAPLTPFTKDGELSLQVLPDYVRFLDSHHIDGVFVLGTMGEGMSLTMDERKRMAEAWRQATRDTARLKTVIVHVGTSNLKDSQQLASHAEKIGVDAIACMAPNYNKPASEEVLVQYMRRVAAAAPSTPFYYYDINFMTGVYLNTAKFLELAADEIPTLRGAKVSSPELPPLTDCLYAAGGRFQVMIGSDEQLLSALALGLRVPILNGHLGGVFSRLKDAFDHNDLDTARREQKLAQQLAILGQKYGGGAPAVKSLMRRLGVDLGSVRLPLTDLSPRHEQELHQHLADMGFTGQ